MAYNEFSIESAIAPRTGRPSVKIQGAANAVRIMQNPSRATEDYVQGAITSLGAANRQILYVNSSLEALNDRLRIASKIAYAVNTSKRRGAEGFGNVPMMNPWEFALEEDNSNKSDGFFRRVWDAIKTACRRVIEAIAHLIKFIGNAVAGMDAKMQQKHFTLWDPKTMSNTKVDDIKFKSPNWNINYSGKGGIVDFLDKVAGAYASGTREVNNNQTLDELKNHLEKNLSDKQNTMVKYSSIDESDSKIDSKDLANQMLQKDLKAIFAVETGSAKDLILKKFCSGDKTVEMTCGKMKALSDDFKCLANTELSKKASKMISTVHDQQKTFTKMTKLIDQIASKVSKPEAKNDKETQKTNMRAISNRMANICNSRIRYNSYWTSLVLEVQMMCLRFNKSAHIALKHYLRAAKKIGDEKKTTETENVSTEALFQF